MKKIILSMVALLSMTAAMAQSENGERKAPKKMTPAEMTTRMAKDLNLTDAQKTKVQALNEEYKDCFGGPRMGGGRPPKNDGQTGATEPNQQRKERPQLTDEQKAKMKEHHAKRQEYDKKLKNILTDEQYKTYQKHHKKHGPHGRHGGPHDCQNGEKNQK